MAQATLYKILQGHSRDVQYVAFSPDNKLIASASEDTTVRLWNIPNGDLIAELKGHKNGVYSVAFSPDGKSIVTGSPDKTVRTWSVATKQQVQILNGHSNDICSVEWSPNGDVIASGSKDKNVILWDAISGSIKKKLTGHTDYVWSVSFSSQNGNKLASGGLDYTAIIWDVNSGAALITLAHSHMVCSVCFSHDDQFVVTGCRDYIVRMFSANTGHEEKRFEGHTNTILSVALSFDGSMIVSCSHDKSVRLWDVASTKQLQELDGHTDWVNAASFSRDGKFIASVSRDNTVRLWDVSSSLQSQNYTSPSTVPPIGPSSVIPVPDTQLPLTHSTQPNALIVPSVPPVPTMPTMPTMSAVLTVPAVSTRIIPYPLTEYATMSLSAQPDTIAANKHSTNNILQTTPTKVSSAVRPTTSSAEARDVARPPIITRRTVPLPALLNEKLISSLNIVRASILKLHSSDFDGKSGLDEAGFKFGLITALLLHEFILESEERIESGYTDLMLRHSCEPNVVVLVELKYLRGGFFQTTDPGIPSYNSHASPAESRRRLQQITEHIVTLSLDELLQQTFQMPIQNTKPLRCKTKTVQQILTDAINQTALYVRGLQDGALPFERFPFDNNNDQVAALVLIGVVNKIILSTTDNSYRVF